MGYEVKGLGWPGREANYDCNSQVPRGIHNGRTIYYVFGRYPSGADDNEMHPSHSFVADRDRQVNGHGVAMKKVK